MKLEPKNAKYSFTYNIILLFADRQYFKCQVKHSPKYTVQNTLLRIHEATDLKL